MRAEEVKPYEKEGRKGKQVEAMFDSIAPAYDFMNTAMTFGMHRRWLHKALDSAWKSLDGREPAAIVDLATGTGEVAFSLAGRFPDAAVKGVDLSEGMLAVAREKLAEREEREERGENGERGKRRIRFVQGDCLALDDADGSFDLLTIAYGVRNFENLEKGFREFYRVLRPGGVCMILELSRPEIRFVRLGYDLYSRTLIPLAGRLVSKDRRAYSYLPESIAAMPPRRRIAEMLGEAGFKKVNFKSMTFGVVTFYIAEK